MTEGLRAAAGLVEPALSAERLHVSLNFLYGGEAPPPAHLVARAVAAAQTLQVPPFRMALNRVVSWKRKEGPRPLVLTGDEGVIGAEGLRTALQGALAEAGLVAGDDKPRWAHLTALWGEHDLDVRLREPIAWTAREVLLLDSLHGAGRQALVGRVPLRPARLPAPRAARPGLPRSAAR